MQLWLKKRCEIGSGEQCFKATHAPPILGECCPGGPLSGPCGGGDDSWCQGVNGTSELPLSCQSRNSPELTGSPLKTDEQAPSSTFGSDWTGQ